MQSLPYNWFQDQSKYPKYLEANLPIKNLHWFRVLLRIADSNIFIWESNQPCVLLIQVDSSNEEEIDQFTQTIQLIKDTFAPPLNDISSSSSVPQLKNTLVAIIDTYEPSVSRKGLLNMATFAAPRRWIVSWFGIRTWVATV